jgi:hypothetical protein
MHIYVYSKHSCSNLHAPMCVRVGCISGDIGEAALLDDALPEDSKRSLVYLPRLQDQRIQEGIVIVQKCMCVKKAKEMLKICFVELTQLSALCSPIEISKLLCNVSAY